MAGGDGSQALVATVAAEHGIPHVCVPAGTRNHFALDLGLDREDVVGALDAFVDGMERRVDLARVNGRVFVNNACMGLYAKIVQSQEYRDAKLKTAADMLPDLLGPDAEPFDLRYTGPDGQDYPTAHLLLVSNNPYELVHIGGFGTREHMDLGTLGVVAARIAGPREAVAFVGLEAAGRIRSFRGWREWDTRVFQVDSGGPIEIGIDGEAMSLDPPLVFESLPGALRVRIPRHAVGVAPAGRAVQLTGQTIVRSGPDRHRTARGGVVTREPGSGGRVLLRNVTAFWARGGPRLRKVKTLERNVTLAGVELRRPLRSIMEPSTGPGWPQVAGDDMAATQVGTLTSATQVGTTTLQPPEGLA